MKKNAFKLGLDLIMALGLMSLFSVAAVGLAFHEVVGLALFGAFVLHLILNWRWIVMFTKKLFSKNVPFKIRLGYWLNVGLLISFVMIIVTGVLMSKFVFVEVFGENEAVKPAHYFFSALGLVLVGVHTGLHWAFIKAMVGRVIKLPSFSIKPLATVSLLLIVVGGAWGLTNSSFLTWIVAPAIGYPEKESGWPEGFEGKGQGGGRHQGNETSGTDASEETEGIGQGYRGGLGATFDAVKTLEVVAQYGSIMILIATITAGTEALIRKRKKKETVTA